MSLNPFQAALIQARKTKGLSQAALGVCLGMPQSHISTLERGLSEPRLSHFIEMARILDFEPMLIPKHLVPIVQATIRGETLDPELPMWRPDEDEDEEIS